MIKRFFVYVWDGWYNDEASWWKVFVSLLWLFFMFSCLCSIVCGWMFVVYQ